MQLPLLYGGFFSSIAAIVGTVYGFMQDTLTWFAQWLLTGTLLAMSRLLQMFGVNFDSGAVNQLSSYVLPMASLWDIADTWFPLTPAATVLALYCYWKVGYIAIRMIKRWIILLGG